ncbi:MAG: succinate dehydrogenase, hydrophobic membrane anchor protein [Rickettsiaceae bacterium]|nr:succinate dehydrogenase, hydrophobic membrane anchor protein [Rickettsiaceae bacterium]
MVKKSKFEMSLTGSGLYDWLIQRVSSLIIGVYFLALIGFFFQHPHLDYSSLRYFFNSIWIQFFTLITLLSIVLHAWIGVWTIITDYIKTCIMRIIIQVAVILTLSIYFIWGVAILWKN